MSIKKHTLETLISHDQLIIPECTQADVEELLQGTKEIKTVAGVYLFKTSHSVLYVGVTDNVRRRVFQHLKGRGNKDLKAVLQNGIVRKDISVYYFEESIPIYRDFYESYLIATKKPRYNISKVMRKKYKRK